MVARSFGPRWRRFRAGDSVRTTMGVRMAGTVADRIFQPHEWSDGTYRPPLNARERVETVPVVWSDGTRGLTLAVHIERA